MKDEEKESYKVGAWNGLPNYECLVDGCPFATLEARDMTDHLRKTHRIGVKVSPPPAPEPKRDRFGNVVETDAPAPAAAPEASEAKKEGAAAAAGKES